MQFCTNIVLQPPLWGYQNPKYSTSSLLECVEGCQQISRVWYFVLIFTIHVIRFIHCPYLFVLHSNFHSCSSPCFLSLYWGCTFSAQECFTVYLLGSEHERLHVLSYYLLAVGPKSHIIALCSSVLNLNICPFCRYHWELSTFINHSAPCWSQQHNFQSLDFWHISLGSEAAMFCESQFLSHTWGK